MSDKNSTSATADPMLQVGSNGGLGLGPERAAFEAWIAAQPGHPFAGQYTTLMRKAWNGAASAEGKRYAELFNAYHEACADASQASMEIERLRAALRNVLDMVARGTPDIETVVSARTVLDQKTC